MAKDVAYVSEVTKFLNKLETPKLKQEQQTLRKTWWDVGFRDLEEQEEFEEANVKAKGYEYY